MASWRVNVAVISVLFCAFICLPLGQKQIKTKSGYILKEEDKNKTWCDKGFDKFPHGVRTTLGCRIIQCHYGAWIHVDSLKCRLCESLCLKATGEEHYNGKVGELFRKTTEVEQGYLLSNTLEISYLRESQRCSG
ncbi:hypothetical protein PoB_003108200 [Plakobranchus ocellatus]|uniref:Uncharacterized protein n=1 Tax=Plakobranchus ocellatus TaxID=259542 RepID=A0AAV4AC11_9GAST|nr:hypothetical protein PoB_003108200 [Plakobranchus ocellatus]